MGPLKGIRIIELVGIGPGPFAGMMLADMGAEVIAVDRTGPAGFSDFQYDINRRGKKSIQIDLKSTKGKETLLKLCEGADALFEGFRPGVMEKLGLGPDDIRAQNERLVYGRMTGWGQTGPLSQAAGHDINYIALSGALHSIGPADRTPTPPLNLIGDYGGGGMFLAFGLVCAILEAKNSGKGQVVDTSMVEGSSLLMSLFHTMNANGIWNRERGSNFLDGGAHFYDTYETSDGKYISLGAIEPQFMMAFIKLMGLAANLMQRHMDGAAWSEVKQELSDIFKTKSQAEWCEVLEGSDACFAPVLPFWEAHNHPHNIARKSFIDIAGVSQPAPAPKFSRTESKEPTPPAKRGGDTDAILLDAGFSEEDIEGLRADKVVE
jgi:alpha-methylacyl-CoA racemase